MAAADAISKFEAITRQDMSRVVPVLQRLAAYQLQPDAANRAALATEPARQPGQSEGLYDRATRQGRGRESQVPRSRAGTVD